jgi:hypothetical protein
MDTNGNPLKDVTVYLAGKTTKTDAGGIYVFNDVPVVNTTSSNVANSTANALQVTIAAPTGFLGATVTVTPQAQQISSEDTPTTAGTSGQANPNTNFIDGYIASAGTAVLPKLGAKVTGRLELANSEAPIANQEISLDFRTVGNAVGGNVAQTQNGVTTTYATNTGYAVMTDANGIFEFVHLPMDTQFAFVVPNYNINGIQGSGAITLDTTSETSLQNIGDLQVTSVVQSDTLPPYVTGVTGTIGNTVAPQMMEDDIRTTFVINFSEAMSIESDDDYTNSVIVKAGETRATMTDVNATATVGEDGKSIIVKVDKELPDATLLDINLLVTDFKDKAGNFLTVNNTAADQVNYDSAGVNGNNTQVVALQLQIFDDLNTDAAQVKTITQMTTDETDINDAELLQAANSAFADVIDSGTPDNLISNMNSRDDDNQDGIADVNTRLSLLGTSALGSAVTMNTNVARVSFVPSNAASYIIALTRNTTPVSIQGNLLLQGGITTGTLTNLVGNANNVIFTPTDAKSTEAVEIVLQTAINARPNDILTITPVDELGYVGTENAITLKDNVVPTTVLQPSYGLGGNTNSSNTVVKFGDGGELAESSGSAKAGTPYLAITAGLLDNLNAAGAHVTGVVPSDNTLSKELYALNTYFDDDNDANTPKIQLQNIYDSTAFKAMKRERTIGVAFSEDVDLNGTTPLTTNISTTLNAWKNNNDVVINDDNGPVNVDLINFTASNVETLANNDNGGIIDFTGIVDNAGNAATTSANAKVVLIDKLPPFVTEASFTGEKINITFNEPIILTDNLSSVTIAGITALYRTVNEANYELSTDKKTLSISVSEFAGLTRANFTLGKYAESAYGTEAREHASMSWSIEDVHGNDWIQENAGVVAPEFAVADLIGDFIVTTDNSGFKISDDTTTTDQKVVWTFNHPIQTGQAGDLVQNATGTNDVTADMEAVIGGNAEALTKADLTLSADKKILTLVFKTTTDASSNFDGIRIKASVNKNITSAVDTAQSETISANAN